MTITHDFLKKFNEAFATNDISFIMNSLGDNIVWTMVGNRTFEGKPAVEAALGEMKNMETLEMKISQIIVNGAFGAANGNMKIKDSSGKIQSYAFADFYEFNSPNHDQINKMVSYVLPLKEEQKNEEYENEQSKNSSQFMV